MMNLKEQHPVVKFLVAASLVLTVTNLTFNVIEHIKKARKSNKEQKG